MEGGNNGGRRGATRASMIERFATCLLLLAGCGGTTAATPTDGGRPSEGGATGPSDAGPTGPTVLVHACGPRGIAVDAHYIYWADGGAGSSPCPLHAGIWRANLDGTGVTSLVTNPTGTVALPEKLVLSGDHVYWVNSDTYKTPTIPPFSGCPKTGCAVGESFGLDASRFAYGNGLAVSGAGIFWAGGVNVQGVWPEVWRIADDAGSAGALVNHGPERTGDVAVDGANVYFGLHSFDGGVGIGSVAVNAPLVADDGGGSSFTAIGDLPVGDAGLMPPYLASLALDDTTIYFALAAGQAVGSFPKSGGPATVLAWNPDAPQSIAIDDTTVYWGTAGNPANQALPSVKKCSKTGCPSGPTVLGTFDYFVDAVAVDAQYVYASVPADGTIVRMAK